MALVNAKQFTKLQAWVLVISISALCLAAIIRLFWRG